MCGGMTTSWTMSTSSTGMVSLLLGRGASAGDHLCVSEPSQQGGNERETPERRESLPASEELPDEDIMQHLLGDGEAGEGE